MSYKVGLFGGSFNPIHNGHISVIKAAFEQQGLDKVIVIPARISPTKDNADYKADFESAEHRKNMCILATQELPFAEVSDFELNRDCKSYTIDTVEYFKSVFKRSELFLIMGADSYETFHEWQKSNEIEDICKLAVYPRKGSDIVQTKTNLSKPLIINADLIDISSTFIRNTQNFHCFLPRNVVEYINENNLYCK